MFSLRTIAVLAVAICTAQLGGSALGEVLSFEQLPLNGGLAPSSGGAAFPGHSELSTATPGGIVGFSGTYAADDFSLQNSNPIVQVEWWGSYHDIGGGNGVQRFLLSFETDVPADGGVPSHPGTPVISQIVSRGALAPNSGTFTEAAIPTAGGAAGQLFHYTANLEIPMLQFAGDVYWLKIVAMVDPDDEGNIAWGWQNRDYELTNPLASPVPSPGEHSVANGLGLSMWHFQDDAVTGGITIIPVPQTNLAAVQQDGFAPMNYVDGSDGPAGINQFGEDLAFRLHTMEVVPEPSTLVLASLGGAAALLIAFRRRRR